MAGARGEWRSSVRMLYLYAGRPERVDELCGSCWKPALVTFPLLTLSGSGVSEQQYLYCTDCRKRITA